MTNPSGRKLKQNMSDNELDMRLIARKLLHAASYLAEAVTAMRRIDENHPHIPRTSRAVADLDAQAESWNRLAIETRSKLKQPK